MQFQPIEIPAGWKEYFSAYPHGLSIWEALSSTITSVNEGIEEVNKKVSDGLLAIEQAETTINENITLSFNTFKSQLQSDFGDLETDLLASINTALSDVYTKSQVYTKAEVDAQLNDIEQDKAEKADVGLLSGLLTTAKTSIVNAINELFNSKANKVQEAWITPTLLNGWINDSVNGFVGLRYMKDSMGFVHIEGGVNNLTSTGAIIFNLPVGYRKSAALVAPSTPSFIRINSNGDVFPMSNTTQVKIYLVFKAD